MSLNLRSCERGESRRAAAPSVRATVYGPIAAFASLTLAGPQIGAAARLA
jgi:hypothetical protein